MLLLDFYRNSGLDPDHEAAKLIPNFNEKNSVSNDQDSGSSPE